MRDLEVRRHYVSVFNVFHKEVLEHCGQREGLPRSGRGCIFRILKCKNNIYVTVLISVSSDCPQLVFVLAVERLGIRG